MFSIYATIESVEGYQVQLRFAGKQRISIIFICYCNIALIAGAIHDLSLELAKDNAIKYNKHNKLS